MTQRFEIVLRKVGESMKQTSKNRTLATLTPAEDKAWRHAFCYAITELDYDATCADMYAWQDIVKQFPRLATFEGCTAVVAE